MAILLEDMARSIAQRRKGALMAVVRELGKELGRQVPDEGETWQAALVASVELIAQKPREQVVAAARAIHERLFGRPPPRYERVPI